ncbi:MAG TPA: ATP-binding protein [Mucilaginibacter sp.]
MNWSIGFFKKLSLQAKLILIGLIPTLFFLYMSFQLYQTEKQKLELLHNNIRIINRAAAVDELIGQLRAERRSGYEFALKKDQYGSFKNQWKSTELAITRLENTDPELKGIKTYTLLDGLDGIRKNITQLKIVPDAVMAYYTNIIFRISYLDVTPELLTGNARKVNQDIHGLKALSEMNIYLSIINENIYNVLYSHCEDAAGVLNGLASTYQVYKTFEKEFMIKASESSIKSYCQIKQNSALKPAMAYLDASFKRMNIDSTYNDVQWRNISAEATEQLKLLQFKLTARIDNTLIDLETTEQVTVNSWLILLIIYMALITAIVGYTILDIQSRLIELRRAAEKIAVGATGLELSSYSKDVIGRLAKSITKIDRNNKMLAEAANAIGSGNFDVPVKPRGRTDVLGNAILQMKDELQHFTSQKLAHSDELEGLLEVIKQSENYFRQIADQTPFIIWQVNSKGEATYMNKRWLEFTGMEFEESLGIGWMVMLHPDDQEDRVLAEAFAGHIPYATKARFKNANGEYRSMHIQSNPIFDKNEFAGYIGSMTDVTDQMAAEEAILELMHKKDEFLSIASHELKTPLTSIKAYTQLLHKNLNPEEKTFPFVEKTLNHIARLEKLIRDLLDVSRINSGQMHYDLETFQFEDMLKQSIENFRDVSSSHKIIVENIAKGTLMADRIRIEQVFNNLLDNAAKYSPGADTILVDSFIENGNIIVSVQDYGVGVAEKDWRRLFERFYRSEKTSNSFQGLGLGLFISSDIIKRHGGEIWVKSTPGAGSTFYFKLPLWSETGD